MDFRSLVDYIAEFDPDAAVKFSQGLLKAIERLPLFPESGRIVPEFGDPFIREVIRKPCRIVYRLNHEKNTVQIVRIWHAARGEPEL